MFGILSVNKPAGWTSRDVVNRVQRCVRPAKAGHAGTLDPLATGVLVVCLGPATKLISHVQSMPKDYLATFRLGCTSDSEDTETEVRELSAPRKPSREAILAALPGFLGRIRQRPPAYSALKLKGRRAYQLAREGRQFQIEPREVEIYDLEVMDYEYPQLKLRIRCGSGTYVRSLGRDLAESLGTAAVMSALVRTEIGSFQLANCVDVECLTESQIAANLQPASLAVEPLPQIVLNSQEISEIRHGRRTPTSAVFDEGAEIAAFDRRGRLVAIVKEKHPGMLGPVHNFPLSD